MGRNLKQEPLRLGILGCGVFAQRRILAALPETPEVRVVAIQKRDPDEAKVVAKRFGVPASYASRDKLLENPEVEAVYICSLNPDHEQDAIACANAGMDVICEKPLALNSESVRQMIDAFQAAGRVMLVGHCCRFKPAIRRAREFVRNRKLGDLRALRGFAAFIPPAYNWRLDWNLGGGVMRDLGIHIIDFIRFVTGEEIVSVMAQADPNFSPATGKADTSCRAILRLQSGVLTEVNVAFDQIQHNGFELVGTEAILTGWQSFRQANEPGEWLRFFNEVGFSEIALPKNNMYAEQLRHFADVILGREDAIISAEQGLRNQRVLDAIYRSIEEKRETGVEED